MTMKEKHRKYDCSECGKPLTEGLEYQFPPRLSYWYCKNCQQIYKEINMGEIRAYAPVAGNEKLCVQDNSIRGFVEDTRTGKITYPDDLPALYRGNWKGESENVG